MEESEWRSVFEANYSKQTGQRKKTIGERKLGLTMVRVWDADRNCLVGV